MKFINIEEIVLYSRLSMHLCTLRSLLSKDSGYL